MSGVRPSAGEADVRERGAAPGDLRRQMVEARVPDRLRHRRRQFAAKEVFKGSARNARGRDDIRHFDRLADVALDEGRGQVDRERMLRLYGRQRTALVDFPRRIERDLRDDSAAQERLEALCGEVAPVREVLVKARERRMRVVALDGRSDAARRGRAAARR